MAAYRREDDCLTAPGPTLGNEYGKPLPFLTDFLLALRVSLYSATDLALG